MEKETTFLAQTTLSIMANLDYDVALASELMTDFQMLLDTFSTSDIINCFVNLAEAKGVSYPA